MTVLDLELLFVKDLRNPALRPTWLRSNRIGSEWLDFRVDLDHSDVMLITKQASFGTLDEFGQDEISETALFQPGHERSASEDYACGV